jgi:hypothetical protein
MIDGSSIQKHARLGKCTLCNDIVLNDESRFGNRYATIISQKWFCGECLVAIKPIVDEASAGQEMVDEIHFKFADSLTVDPATGRLRKE